MNHESGNLLNLPSFPATNEFSSICEQDVGLEKEEAQVEDDDDGNIYNIWDITVEDILNVTMVDEVADFNPTKDIEEIERLLAKDSQSHFTEIQIAAITASRINIDESNNVTFIA
ncbi:hypothetical protein Tco_0767125 [Tanacetum coccineum]